MFMSSCTFFVFLSLIEYAFVNVMMFVLIYQSCDSVPLIILGDRHVHVLLHLLCVPQPHRVRLHQCHDDHDQFFVNYSILWHCPFNSPRRSTCSCRHAPSSCSSASSSTPSSMSWWGTSGRYNRDEKLNCKTNVFGCKCVLEFFTLKIFG
jgi:hypothetical protein